MNRLSVGRSQHNMELEAYNQAWGAKELGILDRKVDLEHRCTLGAG